MVTIIFESHATSEDNEAKLASGWADAPLSPVGEDQARALGERYRGRRFDAIYCSDLARSYRTGEIGFGAAVRDARLRECNYGRLNRAPVAQIAARQLAAITKPFPGGESYQDTARRMRSFLRDLAATRDGQVVLVIGHRATQYALEHWTRGASLEAAIAAPWQWQPGWTYELEHGMVS